MLIVFSFKLKVDKFPGPQRSAPGLPGPKIKKGHIMPKQFKKAKFSNRPRRILFFQDTEQPIGM